MDAVGGIDMEVENTELEQLNKYAYNTFKKVSSVNPEKQKDDWDELEKSVIASVADDVIVGVKGKQAEITVIKKFA